MVTIAILVLIYLSFICLGLPDSLLGSSWQAMYGDLDASVSSAGIISLIVSSGTIVSSFFSERVISRLGTGKTTAISILLTALSLLGFSISGAIWQLCLFAIPLGLGAGSVDAALNNYVALHYKARHMSWLHCFWGVGATVGPMVFSRFLVSGGAGWRTGYTTIAFILLTIVVILTVTLPLWKIAGDKPPAETDGNGKIKHKKLSELVSMKGAKATLFCFFCYCALEATTGLWGSSFLVMTKNITTERAAAIISLFYLGIAVGRFLSGFATMKLGGKILIRIGQALIVAGIITLALPQSEEIILAVGIALIGLGCAPVYPSIIHATPIHFGEESSQAMIGVQMASAYVGSTFMPPVFGLIAEHVSCALFPLFLGFFIVLMLIMSERVNVAVKR